MLEVLVFGVGGHLGHDDAGLLAVEVLLEEGLVLFHDLLIMPDTVLQELYLPLELEKSTMEFAQSECSLKEALYLSFSPFLIVILILQSKACECVPHGAFLAVVKCFSPSPNYAFEGIHYAASYPNDV